MQKSLDFLTWLSAAACSAALLGAAATPPPAAPETVILTLESQRTLGSGQLAAFLNGTDQPLAVRAALAIGRTKQAAGAALLAAHLADSRTPLRAMSVYGLGLLATGLDSAQLVKALRDPAGAVRIAAVDALDRYEAAGRLGPGEAAALTAISREVASDPDAAVRARAAAALVEFRAAGAAPAAQAAMKAVRSDADESVRWHAMWAIFRGLTPAVPVAFVQSMLHDPSELVRVEAVRAMSRYKDAALIASVQPLLDDPSWRVQEQASETVRVLSGKPMSDHWTAIPASVHLPAIGPDAFANVQALPRPAASKPRAPAPSDAAPAPIPMPVSASDMISPVAGPHPWVRVVTTKGNVYVKLYPEWAPLTVANFINLANGGYYDGNRWFRIVPDFVVQTGDPNDNGEGDAGFSVGAEENPLEQTSYVISMGMNYDDKTNLPLRDSAGTQYYVTLSPQLHLDRDFTVFGHVVSGADVLAHLVESDRVVRVEALPPQ
jgi:cyclophilin family peptidyl-prolyl cis-trans isomerase